MQNRIRTIMLRLFSAALLMLLAAGVGADLASQPFSAEMVTRGADGTTTTGRMYVGEERMRVEMANQGRMVIRIVDQSRGTEWVLFPGQRQFIEHAAAAQAGPGSSYSADKQDPCNGMPGLTCRNLGIETIAGRSATKWEITASRQGQTMTITQWIDDERGIPLAQELPNGQTMRLKPVGNEMLEGRQVEKWEMIASAPNQPERRTFQWYDPELKLVIKQELPGGVVTELKGIQIGEQPDSLFVVPSDYTRMPPPRQGRGMPAR